MPEAQLTVASCIFGRSKAHLLRASEDFARAYQKVHSSAASPAVTSQSFREIQEERLYLNSHRKEVAVSVRIPEVFQLFENEFLERYCEQHGTS